MRWSQRFKRAILQRRWTENSTRRPPATSQSRLRQRGLRRSQAWQLSAFLSSTPYTGVYGVLLCTIHECVDDGRWTMESPVWTGSFHSFLAPPPRLDSRWCEIRSRRRHGWQLIQPTLLGLHVDCG